MRQEPTRRPSPTRYRRGTGTTTPEDAAARAAAIARALAYLRAAAAELTAAPAPAAAAYLRRCQKSIEGAARHADGLMTRYPFAHNIRAAVRLTAKPIAISGDDAETVEALIARYFGRTDAERTLDMSASHERLDRLQHTLQVHLYAPRAARAQRS